MRKILILFIVLFLWICISMLQVVIAEPNGANVTEKRTERAPNDTAQGIPAQAGNVTELNIFGYTTTQSWQGYFGNITGAIRLADAVDNVMYNWSLASPQGEIYASKNNTISWPNVQCFNFTATGAMNPLGETPGATNQKGTNLTQIEDEFSINASDVDGVNETFTLLGTGHNTFYVHNLEFSIGECRNTRIFDNTGKGVNNNFEEVLLYEPTTTSVVFTTLLNQNQAGFDSGTHDFEMLVLEDGHGTDVSVTNYYFWVELE
jgi:hypothetical protein